MGKVVAQAPECRICSHHPKDRETLVDGYTYMIERNKLLIQQAREREQAGHHTPLAADTRARERERLMELYDQLQGCGREESRDSE